MGVIEMLSAEQIYQSIENIVKAKGTNDTKMLANAGLKKNVMTNIKNGSMPSIDKIAAIAGLRCVSMFCNRDSGLLMPFSLFTNSLIWLIPVGALFCALSAFRISISFLQFRNTLF